MVESGGVKMVNALRGYAKTSYGQLHYVEVGEGPQLVLLGETPRSSRFFTPILPLIAPRVHAVAIDLPGLGESHPLPEPSSVEVMAACVADALDAMGVKRAHLFGMHTGNKVAAALAAARPDLVDRLILAGQTHSLFPETERRNAALGPAFSRYRAAEDEPAAGKPFREWLRTKLILDAAWWPELLVIGAAEEEAVAGAEQKAIDFMLGWRSAIPIYRAVFAQDLAGTVARIQAASLVLELTTEEEASLGLQGERLAKLMPHAISRTLPITYGAGMERQTAAIADAILTFLFEEPTHVR